MATDGSNGGPSTPDIDSLHRDLAFANTYRLELIKFMLTVAAGLFAFTVTFRPSLHTADWKLAMWIGWAGLAVSLAGGMGQLSAWEHFYKSYQQFDWKGRKAEGKEARNAIDDKRKFAMRLQIVTLAIGVAGVGAFAAVNIDNVKADDCKGCAAAKAASSPAGKTP